MNRITLFYVLFYKWTVFVDSLPSSVKSCLALETVFPINCISTAVLNAMPREFIFIVISSQIFCFFSQQWNTWFCVVVGAFAGQELKLIWSAIIVFGEPEVTEALIYHALSLKLIIWLVSTDKLNNISQSFYRLLILKEHFISFLLPKMTYTLSAESFSRYMFNGLSNIFHR